MKIMISEIFYSLQGEGIQIGIPTVFVRLFGCDLRCSWCDSMYAVEGTDFGSLEINDVINTTLSYQCSNVCITGGEPLLQLDQTVYLTEKLIEVDKRVILETAGHRKPPDIFENSNTIVSMDCKCPSSGMDSKSDLKNLIQLKPKDQIKFVIANNDDYIFAKNIVKQNPLRAEIIFQPVYGHEISEIADAVIKDKLKVRVLPQLHKDIWGDIKGV